MNRFSLVACLVTVSAFAGIPAHAGQKVPQPVKITTQSNGTFVYGAVGDARASSDGSQAIHCGTAAYPDGYAYAVCTATDSSRRTVACFVRSPSMLQAIASIGPSSYIHFSIPPASGDCDALTVENGSRYRPATP
jgi:hypothetical protein